MTQGFSGGAADGAGGGFQTAAADPAVVAGGVGVHPVDLIAAGAAVAGVACCLAGGGNRHSLPVIFRGCALGMEAVSIVDDGVQGIPGILCAAEIDIRQVVAVGKCPAVQICQPGREGNAAKIAAAAKGQNVKGGDRRDGDTFQIAAAIKRKGVQVGGRREGNAGQAAALIKRALSNGCGRREGDVRQIPCGRKRIAFNRLDVGAKRHGSQFACRKRGGTNGGSAGIYGVSAGFCDGECYNTGIVIGVQGTGGVHPVGSVAIVHSDGAQFVAVPEGIAADGGHTAGNGDAGQTVTVFKGIVTDGFQGGWEGNAGQTCTVQERTFLDGPQIAGQRNALQTLTGIKGLFANGGDGAGDGNAGHGSAGTKSIILDGGNTGGNGDTFELVAVKEGRFADGGDGAGNGDSGQPIAAVKGVVTDAGHTAGNVDSREALTVLEGVDADLVHAGRQGDGGQTLTSGERRVTQIVNRGGNRDAGHVLAAVEGVGADAGDAGLENGFLDALPVAVPGAAGGTPDLQNAVTGKGQGAGSIQRPGHIALGAAGNGGGLFGRRFGDGLCRFFGFCQRFHRDGFRFFRGKDRRRDSSPQQYQRQKQTKDSFAQCLVHSYNSCSSLVNFLFLSYHETHKKQSILEISAP